MLHAWEIRAARPLLSPMGMRALLAISLAAAVGCGASRLDGSGTGGSPGGGLGGSPGTVTFVVKVPPDFSFCDQYTCPEPAPQHLIIETPDGQPVNWPAGTCGTVDCNTCAPVRCPLIQCPGSLGLVYTGGTAIWDGSYLASSTCGASGTTCAQPRYAAPGPYVAHVCATPGTVDHPDSPPATCVNSAPTVCAVVPFTFPSATPIEVELPVYHPL